jgi:hypothetical protein
MRILFLCQIVTLVACACMSTAFGVESQVTIASRLLAADDRAATLSTDDSESAALLLVRDELPQLRRVLDRLRSDAPSQYEKAIRDISRSAKRLESMRARDEKLYLYELDLLKARTSISLIVARLKVRDDEGDRKSLQAAIGQLRTAELSRAKYEVELLEKRIKRSEEQLSDAQTRLSRKTAEFDNNADKVYIDYLRKAGRSADGSTTKKRPREKDQVE